ncbi:MAG: DUF2716 domain-containing protein [Lachnospiraceae bacterium]|nr:DUF2716 domain-containing protein [Lachnospiraceae bacterium]
MIIDNTQEDREIWDKVYTMLNFNPSVCDIENIHSITENVPFELVPPYSVYAIENMTIEQRDLMEELVRNSLILCTDGNKEWYALNWQHSSFRFHPQNMEEQQSLWVEDEQYWDGGYNAYFPSFYPNGDYYFFIDQDFENGFLGHPWRQEVWVFGTRLCAEIKKIYQKLGWYLLRTCSVL